MIWFHEFVETITPRIKEIFRISRGCKQCFKYIGVNIFQSDDILEIVELYKKHKTYQH